MATNFAAQVAGFVAKSEDLMLRVVKTAAQEVFEEAQRVGPSVANPGGGEGGKMPVDTNALRNSFKASLTGLPSGFSANAAAYDDSAVTLTIAGVKAGDTIYAGWTAEYAIFMEHRYGFMRSAAQQWQPIVTQVVAELGARTR